MRNIITFPGAACAPDASIDQLIKQICDLIEVRPMHYMHAQVCHWCAQDGVERDMLLLAAGSTARAPRPSWRYLAAIVGRCVQEGVLTAGGYNARQLRFAFRGSTTYQSRTVTAQHYSQRSYTAEELNALTEDLMQEAQLLDQKEMPG